MAERNPYHVVKRMVNGVCVTYQVWYNNELVVGGPLLEQVIAGKCPPLKKTTAYQICGLLNAAQ